MEKNKILQEKLAFFLLTLTIRLAKKMKSKTRSKTNTIDRMAGNVVVNVLSLGELGPADGCSGGKTSAIENQTKLEQNNYVWPKKVHGKWREILDRIENSSVGP